MKEYVTLKPIAISVTTGLLDQMLNTAVDPFCGCIAQVVAKVCHDVLPVAFEKANNSFNRFQSGRHGLAAPLLEVSHSIGLVRALSQRPEKLFDLPCSGRLRQ